MAGNDDSGIEQIQQLDGFQDSNGGVTVKVKEHMEADVFAPLLKASISSWKQQGKKVMWIKLPIRYSHLIDIIVREGFTYHHSESSYRMLVRWLPATLNPIPVNASYRVGICAFVLNDKREVLVVQEKSGRTQGTGVWKLPTGVVNEGEDIGHAVVREAREKTGVETKFIQVLCFTRSHRSCYTKSDLLFLCELQPNSTIINIEKVEIEAAQWIPIEEYAAQPFIVHDEQFKFMARIMARAGYGYPGFTPFATTTRRGRRTNIYCNNPGV